MALKCTFVFLFILHNATAKDRGKNKDIDSIITDDIIATNTDSVETSSSPINLSAVTEETILGSTVNECERHRKPWHELSLTERELYINGFLTLSNQGKMAVFTAQHSSDMSRTQAHSTAAFLPWHRYFLIEVENAFRSLGEQYTCFALPYWDFSYETTLTSNISDFVIMNSGLGSFGDPTNEYCLDDERFGQGNYVPHLCTNNGECCLRRGNCQSNSLGDCVFQTPQQTIAIISKWEVYGTDEYSSVFNGFRYNLEYGSHARAHNYIGNGGHLSSLRYSPDDPIFYLLHSFTDYQWALWQSCKGFDAIHRTLINESIYGGTLDFSDFSQTGRGPSILDNYLRFDTLSDYSWTRLATHNTEYTPRDMHNINDWGVSYEKGSFWESADVDSICPNTNEHCFYDWTDDAPIVSANINAEMSEMTVTESAKESARRKMRESISGIYAKNSNELLKAKYGWNGLSKESEKEIVAIWSELSCSFNQMFLSTNCRRPKYFDDCEDFVIEPHSADINISLAQMIARVNGVECMAFVRTEFYDWARESHTLLGLCRGDYDIFCDDSFKIKHENEETCVTHMMGKIANKNEKSINALSVGANYDLKMSEFSDENSDGISETERIALKAVMNGLVIIFIISFIGIAKMCYVLYLRNISNNLSMECEKVLSSDFSDFNVQNND